VTNTIASVQQLYWDLVNAIQDYEIQRESVTLAQISVVNNREKVRIGVLAPIEITVAQADMSNRIVDLISSQKAINVAENNLRATISGDRNNEIWQKTIVPTDAPDFTEYKIDLGQALDTALQHRPELEQLNLQLSQNQINYDVTRNLKKWQWDFVGSFGTVGVAGPQTLSSTGEPIIDPGLVGSIGTAYKSLFSQGFRNWFAGFNVQIPLRNRNIEGQLGQLDVQKRQMLMSRQNTEQKIVVQIRNAFQDLETNAQQVEAVKVARELAQEQLDGETKRFQAGMSQNFLVLQRQRDLSTAKGAEMRALIAYKKSVIALQQAMYTLLDASDFEIAGSGTVNRPIPALK
jgi:outer membrane protein